VNTLDIIQKMQEETYGEENYGPQQFLGGRGGDF